MTRQLSIFERYKIIQALDTNLDKHEDKTCTYRNGMTDRKILEILQADIPKLSLNNVTGTRVQLFGPLRKTQGDPDIAARISRIEDFLISLDLGFGRPRS